jgi:hypothetical protein
VSHPPPKRENPLINLVCNIVIPTIVLTKLSEDPSLGRAWGFVPRLGPFWSLIVALLFPVGYGIYDLIKRKKTNVLSILGFVSVLCSGGLALAKVGGLGFAIKDALLPTIIGLAVLLTLRTKTPLVRELLYNESIIDVPRVDAALEARGHREQFERLLRRASIGLAATFLASAPVNFALALAILKSPPGTPAFNAELGKMHWVGPLVIAVPSMIVLMIVFIKLMNGLAELSGLTQEEIFREEKKK